MYSNKCVHTHITHFLTHTRRYILNQKGTRTCARDKYTHIYVGRSVQICVSVCLRKLTRMQSGTCSRTDCTLLHTTHIHANIPEMLPTLPRKRKKRGKKKERNKKSGQHTRTHTNAPVQIAHSFTLRAYTHTHVCTYVYTPYAYFDVHNSHPFPLSFPFLLPSFPFPPPSFPTHANT